MPGMTKEERRKLKAEKNEAKRQKERQAKQEKQQSPEYQAKLKQKRKEELQAMHNIKTETEKAMATREKLAQKSIGKQVGSSAENKKWEQKRKDRYNQKVWKGWRESDGEVSPVTTYKLEE